MQIFRDGAGQAGLGLEVERWEGVVREVSTEPTALREMSEAEKKVSNPALSIAFLRCADLVSTALCRFFEF